MWRSSLTINFLALFILPIFLMGCSKYNKLEKELNGDWSIVTFEFTNPNGLSYYYPAVGNLTYEAQTETEGTFLFNYKYFNGIDTIVVYESGKYAFNYGNTEFYDLYRSTGATTYDTIKKARVILLTKTDLRTEMTEFNGRRAFVLEK